MQQPGGGEGGTHQTLLKEATNQQNATCYVFLLSASLSHRRCYLQAIFAAHLGLKFRTFSPLDSWHTSLHGWSATSASPLGIPDWLGSLPAAFQGPNPSPTCGSRCWFDVTLPTVSIPLFRILQRRKAQCRTVK